MEAVRNKEEPKEKDNYIYRKGKKIKQKRYGGRRQAKNIDEQVHGYFKEEKEREEYEKRVRDMEDALIKCATLLVKEGLKLTEKTSEEAGEMTPLFVAVSAHNYKLAQWFVDKEPTAIQGKFKEGARAGWNILHLLSLDFFNY